MATRPEVQLKWNPIVWTAERRYLLRFSVMLGFLVPLAPLRPLRQYQPDPKYVTTTNFQTAPDQEH